MKSKDYLEKVYQNQLSSFNLKKETKKQNLLKSIENTQSKINSLQQHLLRLQQELEETNLESFQTFEEFFRKIQQRSEKDKSERKTSNT
jgi:4-diphosphocytidyl-2C-methyl-D-erythritol kinase